MLISPKPPIFLIDGLDVTAFDTIENAVQFFEPVDVKMGEIDAYDSEGRLLHFGVEYSRGSGFWGTLLSSPDYTVLIDVEAEPRHASQLREKLVAFLRHFGADESSLSHASLPELVGRVMEGEKGGLDSGSKRGRDS